MCVDKTSHKMTLGSPKPFTREEIDLLDFNIRPRKIGTLLMSVRTLETFNQQDRLEP